MSKYQALRIHDPVYKTALEVFVCADPIEWQKFMDFYGCKHKLGTPGAGKYVRLYPGDCAKDLEADSAVMFLRNKDMGVLVHELSHHIHCTFDDKDIPVNWDTSEVFAYYMEFLLNQILEAWKPKKKRKR